MSAALSGVVERHLGEAAALRQDGGHGWWRRHEAVMLGLGSLKKLVLEGVASGSIQLNVDTFLENVVLNDLNQNGKKLNEQACTLGKRDKRLPSTVTAVVRW